MNLTDMAIGRIPRSRIAISRGRWFVISVEIFKSPFQRGGPFCIPLQGESLVSHSFSKSERPALDLCQSDRGGMVSHYVCSSFLFSVRLSILLNVKGPSVFFSSVNCPNPLPILLLGLFSFHPQVLGALNTLEDQPLFLIQIINIFPSDIICILILLLGFLHVRVLDLYRRFRIMGKQLATSTEANRK